VGEAVIDGDIRLAAAVAVTGGLVAAPMGVAVAADGATGAVAQAASSSETAASVRKRGGINRTPLLPDQRQPQPGNQAAKLKGADVAGAAHRPMRAALIGVGAAEVVAGIDGGAVGQ
jgi:hypothetical protein